MSDVAPFAAIARELLRGQRGRSPTGVPSTHSVTSTLSELSSLTTAGANTLSGCGLIALKYSWLRASFRKSSSLSTPLRTSSTIAGRS